MRHAPWNEDDADTYAWANLFAGLALIGVGIAFLVACSSARLSPTGA